MMVQTLIVLSACFLDCTILVLLTTKAIVCHFPNFTPHNSSTLEN